MVSKKGFLIIVCVVVSIALVLRHTVFRPKDTVPPQEADFCSSIHPTDTSRLGNELKPLADNMRTKTGVYVLEDGGGSLVTRAWLCEHAEKTIDIQYFIFSTDNVGLIACDYLVRAADRGVKVRIIVDDLMVEAGIGDVLALDSHKNISIKIYNPGQNLGKNVFQKLGKLATHYRSFNQRMHNKVFAVDGKVVITGGRNMADEYFDYDHAYNFRDRDVLLLGKAVGEVESSFERFWNSPIAVAVGELQKGKDTEKGDSTRFDRLHEYACNPENFWPQIRSEIVELPKVFHRIMESGRLVWLDRVSFVSDELGKNDGRHGMGGGGVTTSALARLIGEAKYSIDIQSPYLIVTDEALQLMKEAIARGVRIRILTNSLASTDNPEAFAGYQKNRRALLDAGVDIYEFRPDAAERVRIATGALQKKLNYSPVFGLHAKTMVIDGAVSAIGTFNVDPRSSNLNTECFALVYSKQIAQGVLRGMNDEYKPENSWHVTAGFNPDSKASGMKRLNTFTKKVFPRNIL